MLLPLSLLLLVVDYVHAVRIPFVVETNSLSRRESLSVGNTGNAQYVANITVAGNNIPVLLDTGSSDLWVYFKDPPKDRSSITDSGKQVELMYAVGKAAGHAQRTRITLGEFTVEDQAFLLVEDTSTFTGDIRAQGYQGLLGLGPNTGSVVRKKLDKKNADTIVQNIFNRANLGENYITLLLDRKNDLHDPFKGEMTISELVPGFENITSMPKLDVDTVTRLLRSDQHWQALTDENKGVIGPDGVPIEFESIVPRAPDGQLVAVIDSGFTFSQVPREIADGIYGRVKGAVYDAANEWWLLPCGQYLDISFNFGGVNYPMHPLDVVDDNFSKIDSTGKKVCIGSFQPITSAFSMLGHYDMILGMNFLRSAYSLYNFGMWIDKGSDEHPYIQMAPLTDKAAARKEFVELRLAGQDTIDTDARWAILPLDQLQKSPVSDEEKKKKYQEMVLSRWPYILLGCLAFVGLSIGFCIWRCCKRRQRNGGSWTQRGALNRGLFGGRRRGNDGDDSPGMNDIAERDRETELYHGQHAATMARGSIDTRNGRASNQYSVRMDERNPFGSTAELVRTQSHQSAGHASPYQQSFPPGSSNELLRQNSHHSAGSPSPYQQNFPPQQQQQYGGYAQAPYDSSPHLQQYPQPPSYDANYQQNNQGYGYTR